MKLEDIKENVMYVDSFHVGTPVVMRFVKRIANVMRFVVVSDHPAVSGRVLDYSTCDAINLKPFPAKTK